MDRQRAAAERHPAQAGIVDGGDARPFHHAQPVDLDGALAAGSLGGTASRASPAGRGLEFAALDIVRFLSADGWIG
ncbi:MAG: hypothetical protein U0X73_15355 [Thermoanaerobaculia bacterium]